MSLSSVLKNIITETDGETYELVSILAILSVVIGLSLQVWVVLRPVSPEKFDFQQFGIGMAAVFTGVGVALKLKPESK